MVLWNGRDITCDDVNNICEFSNGQQVLEDVLNITDDQWTTISTNLLHLALQIMLSRFVGYLRFVVRVDYEDDLAQLFNFKNKDKINIDTTDKNGNEKNNV